MEPTSKQCHLNGYFWSDALLSSTRLGAASNTQLLRGWGCTPYVQNNINGGNAFFIEMCAPEGFRSHFAIG